MKGKKLLATLAVSVLLFTGCGLKSQKAIIKVNDTNITQGQFDEAFSQQAKNTTLAQMGIEITKEKNPFMYYLIQERVINDLIVNALLDQEIEKRGIKITQDDINTEIQGLVTKVGSKEQLSKLLKENKISQAQFKKDLLKSVKMRKLVEQLGIEPTTDAEAKKFYNENPDKFKYPDRVRASHILISANAGEMAEKLRKDMRYKNASDKEIEAKVNEQMAAQEAKADSILKLAKQDPTQFAKLAKENSEDTTSAQRGGDLGFFTAGEMVPEFSKAAFAMKPNTINNKAIKSQFGYHIIMVTDRMAAGKEPYAKSKDNIKAYLDNQKSVDAVDKLTESLKKQAKITYLNSEYDPKVIQKGIQHEINVAPQRMKDAKKAHEARRAKKSK